MEIKATGPGAPFSQPSNVQENAAGNVQPTEVGQPTAAEVLETIRGLSKADLKDPAKLEQAISGSAGELLEAALGRLGTGISDADRAFLVQWLGNDPVMRSKLLAYFEQTLK